MTVKIKAHGKNNANKFIRSHHTIPLADRKVIQFLGRYKNDYENRMNITIQQYTDAQYLYA